MYFENLYQARPGTEEYKEWTNTITNTVMKITREYNTKAKKAEDFTLKDLNSVIRKLKRNKSIGPDEIPNEMFIESDIETRKYSSKCLMKST